MAISRIGSASAEATTLTVPVHAIGDLILIFAYRDGSNVAPTVPATYTSIETGGDNTNAIALGYRIATATNDASGTWTNATELVCIVYRGQSVAAPIGDFNLNSDVGTTVTYPGVAMVTTDGTSWVAGFAGHRSIDTSLETPPSGMSLVRSQVGATAEAVGHDTNTGVTSWSDTAAVVGGTSSGWFAATAEIQAEPVATTSTSSTSSSISTSSTSTSRSTSTSSTSTSRSTSTSSTSSSTSRSTSTSSTSSSTSRSTSTSSTSSSISTSSTSSSTSRSTSTSSTSSSISTSSTSSSISTSTSVSTSSTSFSTSSTSTSVSVTTSTSSTSSSISTSVSTSSTSSSTSRSTSTSSTSSSTSTSRSTSTSSTSTSLSTSTSVSTTTSTSSTSTSTTTVLSAGTVTDFQLRMQIRPEQLRTYL